MACPSGTGTHAGRHGPWLGGAGAGPAGRSRRAPRHPGLCGGAAAAVERRRHRRRSARPAHCRQPPPARARRRPQARGPLAGQGKRAPARLRADRALHPQGMAEAGQHRGLGQAHRRDRRHPGRPSRTRRAGRTATGAFATGAPPAPGLRPLAGRLHAAPARRSGAGREGQHAQAADDRPPCPAGLRAGPVAARAVLPAR